MANLNLSIFSQLGGLLKLITVVVGVVNLGFLGHSYYEVSKEEAFLAAVIICFIVSFFWLLAIVLGLIADSEMMRKIDFAYHFCAALFIVITAICFMVSIIDIDNALSKLPIKFKQARKGEKVFALILGLANSIIYGVIGFLIFKTSSVN